jgi:hypothetical protein
MPSRPLLCDGVRSGLMHCTNEVCSRGMFRRFSDGVTNAQGGIARRCSHNFFSGRRGDALIVQSSQANSGCMLSGARRVRPVIVGCSTAPPAQAVMIMPDACSLPHGSGHSRRNWVVVRTGPRVLARTESSRTQSARHRVDQGTISGRSLVLFGTL